MSTIVQKVFLSYKNFSKRHLTVLNSIQTGILLGSSDLVAQKFVEKRENIDFYRSLQFIGIGALFVGPYSSVFFKKLTLFYETSKHSKKSVVLQKVLLDQFVFAPILVAGVVFGKNALQGKNRDEIRLEFQDKYLEIIKNNYVVWPFLKIVKYNYVPMYYHVLYSQSFAFFWNIYVTWKINCDINEENWKKVRL
ncbi:unnamed protein product [Brassicogethes aeneus]|uniref:Mitochondrial inner membrane protein Mpv17 n=1 Tax=Brassicogethes aeneus TaxID=1431903 RepID=A0A9P0B608_BRAAE|nr:unnamed protein product [Brassicogethes aeneus]